MGARAMALSFGPFLPVLYPDRKMESPGAESLSPDGLSQEVDMDVHPGRSSTEPPGIKRFQQSLRGRSFGDLRGRLPFISSCFNRALTRITKTPALWWPIASAGPFQPLCRLNFPVRMSNAGCRLCRVCGEYPCPTSQCRVYRMHIAALSWVSVCQPPRDGAPLPCRSTRRARWNASFETSLRACNQFVASFLPNRRRPKPYSPKWRNFGENLQQFGARSISFLSHAVKAGRIFLLSGPMPKAQTSDPMIPTMMYPELGPSGRSPTRPKRTE